MIHYLSKRCLLVSLLLLPTPLFTIASITNPAALDTVLANNQYVIIDFWMPGCGPCNALAPILDQMQASLPEVAFAKVNITERTVANLVEKFNIKNVPTLIIFKRDQKNKPQEISRIIGNSKTAVELLETIKDLLDL